MDVPAEEHDDEDELAPSALRPEVLKSIIEQSTPDLSSSQREHEEIRGASLNVEAAERARLSRRPYTRHLDAAVSEQGELLVGVGATVIIDRRCTLLPGMPWLDTRQLVIGAVWPEKKMARGFDEAAKHWVHFGWAPENMTEVRVVPINGKDPWRVPSGHRKHLDSFMEETMAQLPGATPWVGGDGEQGAEGDAAPKKRRRRKQQ